MAVEGAVTDTGVWDTRAWLLALIAPCVLFAISSAATYSPVETILASICPISLWGDDAGRLIGDGATISLVILLPGVLTVVARRRAFLWGALPPLIGEIWTVAEEVVKHEWAWMHFLFGLGQLLPLIVAWFLSSGVGLVVRQARHRRWIRAQHVIMEAVGGDQPEVWPPTPRHDAG